MATPATGITIDFETLASLADLGIIHIGQTGARRINADMTKQFSFDLTVANGDTPGDTEIVRFQATDDISLHGIDIHLVEPLAATTPSLNPAQDWVVAYSIDAALPSGDIIKVGIDDQGNAGGLITQNNPWSSQFLHPAGTTNLKISKGDWVYIMVRLTTNTTVDFVMKGAASVIYWLE